MVLDLRLRRLFVVTTSNFFYIITLPAYNVLFRLALPLFLLKNDKKLCRQAAKHTADAGNFVILPYQIK